MHAGVALALVLQASTSGTVTPPLEVIVDASVTMNGRLGSGETRLQAMRNAVQGLLGEVPDDTTVGVRVYGDQSSRESHDCADTRLLEPVRTLGETREALEAALAGVVPRGTTPLSRALEAAAADFPAPTRGPRIVVLIGDGKEACEADPCATARTLKAAHPELVVHALGLDADEAARRELDCIARATGGTRADVGDAVSLLDALRSALAAEPVALLAEPAGAGTGEIMVSLADSRGHRVLDGSAHPVTSITPQDRVARVPAGTYQVTFGPGSWRGVRVENARRTVLAPARVRIDPPSGPHDVVDAETLAVHATLDANTTMAPVLPGVYEVRFGALSWPDVRLEGGLETVLRPAQLKLARAAAGARYTVRTATGVDAGIAGSDLVLPLPPGQYEVMTPAGRLVAFQAVAGREVVVDVGVTKPSPSPN